jgi:hypothetical protein
LFIPLKRQYFTEYLRGTKATEYRKYGPRWNERVCVVDRPVILSLGYGKKNRLVGKITSFRKVPILKSKGGAAFWLCYGTHQIGPIAEIDIKLEESNGPV